MPAIRSTRIRPITKAKTVQDTLICDVSASVGDLVRASDTIPDGVDVAVDNSEKRPVIGLILNKPTTTSAEILFLGLVNGFSGLTQGATLFLSATGTVTSTVPPGAGYVQILGSAVDPTKILLSPQLRVVRRNP